AGVADAVRYAGSDARESWFVGLGDLSGNTSSPPFSAAVVAVVTGHCEDRPAERFHRVFAGLQLLVQGLPSLRIPSPGGPLFTPELPAFAIPLNGEGGRGPG